MHVLLVFFFFFFFFAFIVLFSKFLAPIIVVNSLLSSESLCNSSHSHDSHDYWKPGEVLPVSQPRPSRLLPSMETDSSSLLKL